MSRYWRIAANPGFNTSIDHIRERLIAGGFMREPNGDAIGVLRVDEFATRTRGWDYTIGTVSTVGETPEVVLSRERDRVSLCINSFPTGPEGLTAALIDVGGGSAKRVELAIDIHEPSWRRSDIDRLSEQRHSDDPSHACDSRGPHRTPQGKTSWRNFVQLGV